MCNLGRGNTFSILGGGRGQAGSSSSSKLTIAVDGAVCTWLLAVALDLFPTTLVAGSGDSTALLERHGGGGVAGSRAVFNIQVGLDAFGGRRGILDRPVRDGQRGGLVVRHGGLICGAEATMGLRRDDYAWRGQAQGSRVKEVGRCAEEARGATLKRQNLQSSVSSFFDQTSVAVDINSRGACRLGATGMGEK